AGVFARKVKIEKMLTNWGIVYIGNFVGSILIVWLMIQTGLFNSNGNDLGAITIRIASSKVGLGFMQAFYLGLLCNWLVCLAVWMSFGAKNIIGKIFAIFFPIWLFVTSGFEHSVANMYYVPAGILAKANTAWAQASGLTGEQLANLNWQSFFANNLLPVTLGNIVGGVVFVALAYWLVYHKNA
ncbi:MAG TPA: FdhC protein, partial [Eubacteriaceae bacterium]|nr:FdhC protein [Eubacteriaceae bacterium]